ncbi:MAG: beta-N-acetylhexosaminidase [Hyphomicrobiaceae bacterium]
MQRAFITGVSGETLTDEERRFVRDARPAGLILFARNCRAAGQIRQLVADFRTAAGDDDVLVLIDQEGGRVQRLKPPVARTLPPARAFATMYAADPGAAVRAAFAVSRLVASELTGLGINTNCAPVLDVPCEGAHDIIGDRAYGRDPATVVALGRAVADGLLAGGVLPVVKHVPGHGRAGADSHVDLPVVDTVVADLERTDFVPFRALADLPAAMTAHVVFSAIDAAAPASVSRVVTQTIIREAIGFDGLLMSDDLSMRALTGTLRSRAGAVIQAGSDLALHCNGNLAEMREVVEGVPVLAGKALQRLERARAVIGSSETPDIAEAEAALDLALATVA